MPRRKLPPLNALAIFEEVAVRRSCSEAALHLGLTQSAVSKQVQAMERFIGAPLFSRTKAGLCPMPWAAGCSRMCSRFSMPWSAS